MNDKDLSERLWDELTFRQSHYWSSFNRFSLAIIVINISPYIRPEIAEPLEEMIYVFPFIALIISIVCTWYLGAEYQRLNMVRKAYNKVIGYAEIVPRMPTDGLWNKFVAKKMGAMTTFTFGVGFSGISILNYVVLLNFPIQALNGNSL